ncbi:MAG: cytochrome c biogenesis protein ResB [Nitrospirae bacterium]|nr:cytochrome c biogenesis protein ResB [Nitrospirota bacterium]
MEKEKKDIFEKVWDFFASVKLTIVILIVLALTSIIGTIIEQQAEPATNIQLLAKFFGDALAPTVYNIFVKFDFMNMYHSWWFVSLLILFSINLIVCSLDRFPKTWRLYKSLQRPLPENVIKTLPVIKEIKIKADIKAVRDEISNILNSSRYRISEETGENTVTLYSEKHKFTHFGFYVVHLSIIFIFIGAIIGARFGFSGFLNLPEGRTSSFALIRTATLSQSEQEERNHILDAIEASGGDISLAVRQLGMPEDIFNAKMNKYGIQPLGFLIKCNWYNTEYYSQTDMPKEFSSELVVIDKGQEVMKKVIEVNSPLTYKGITFYQSSYGMVPNAVGEFIIKVLPKNGREETLELRFGGSFVIPGTNIRGTIVNFSPALSRDRETGALTTYSENMVNPAVAIEFDTPESGKFTGWILKRYPETGILKDGHQIQFENYRGVQYTGLQVAKDPGVWLIYLASIVMAIGLFVSFFMSHKKIWIMLTTENPGKKGAIRITAGGSASKNRLSLEREIEHILSKASHSLEVDSTRIRGGSNK